MDKKKFTLHLMIESLVEKTKLLQTYAKKERIHLNGLDSEYNKLHEVIYRINAILKESNQ